MTQKADTTNPFVSVETIHKAEVAWWWTDEKLHDRDYHIKVWDSVEAKIRELVVKYDVEDDTRYCCQWEGHLLMGENREEVVAAANELARHLARFKSAKPLSYFTGTAQ